MPRIRRLALLAVFASAAISSAFGAHDTPTTDPVDRAASATSTNSGSIATDGGVALPVRAVDPGHAPVVVRSDARQPVRRLFSVAMMIAVAFASTGRRSVRRILEPEIRAQRVLRGPVPGRRAPPPSLVV